MPTLPNIPGCSENFQFLFQYKIFTFNNKPFDWRIDWWNDGFQIFLDKEDWAYLNWKYPTEPSLNLNKGWQHIACKSSEIENYVGSLFPFKTLKYNIFKISIYFTFLVSRFYFAVSSDCKNKYLTWSNSYLNISMEIFKFVVKE